MAKHFHVVGEPERLQPIPLMPLPDNPLVSILLPSYNYGQYIGEAIESVFKQNYPNWELIICDDGSTDNSCEVVKEYQNKEPRIKLIEKENGGMASALNAAYKASRGDIVCLLDADDVFLPTKLSSVVQAFKGSFYPGYVTHRVRIVYGDGQHGDVIPIFTPPELGYLGPKIYKRGGRWRYMPASAICLRREVADLLFPIDENLFRSVADAYIFTLAPILTPVVFIDEVLSFYRLHGSNLTGTGDLSLAALSRTIHNLERIIRGVNDRLCKLGLPPLSIDRNLHYLEQKTFLSLVNPESTVLEQVRSLIALSGATLRDDMYIPVQKLGALFAYWSALVLPKRLRPQYLRYFTHPSRLKVVIKGILNLIRGRGLYAHSRF